MAAMAWAAQKDANQPGTRKPALHPNQLSEGSYGVYRMREGKRSVANV